MSSTRSSRRLGILLTMAAALIIGCEEAPRTGGAACPGEATAAPAATLEKTGAQLMSGTSYTAGLGLQPDDADPALIQERIDKAGLPFRVINTGVSGETSAGALRRLDWLMRQDFDVLLLETGANDMLRGTDLASTEDNIQQIIDRVRQERPRVTIVLAGMMAPPNLGREYAEAYARMYVDLAEKNDLPLIPFLLYGVGGVPEMNQADGIHPNEEGARQVADNVWQVLEP